MHPALLQGVPVLPRSLAGRDVSARRSDPDHPEGTACPGLSASDLLQSTVILPGVPVLPLFGQALGRFCS